MVNDTKDDDTSATIIGATVGALRLRGIPGRWVKRLAGRIRSGSGSQVFRLILHTK